MLVEQGLLPAPVPLYDPASGSPPPIPAISNPATGETIPLKSQHKEVSTNFGEVFALEAFIDGTVDVTETWSVTAGLRGTYEDVTGAYEVEDSETPGSLGAFFEAAPNNLFPSTNGERLSESETFTSMVGRLATRYQPLPEANLFASVSRGRRPNVIEVDETGATILDDEIVWSYETGVKGLLLDDRAQYDVSGFYYDYSDFQTTIIEETGQPRTVDVGKASALGFEVLGRFALTAGVEIFSNYAFIDAEFDDEDSDGNPQQFAGNTFRLTPDHTFSAGLNADIPAGPLGTAFIRPTVTWQSEVFFNAENTDDVRGDGYTLVDVRAGVQLPGGNLELTGAVENVFDTEYIIDAGNTGRLFGTPTYIAGQPRTFRLTLSAGL